MNKSSLKMFGLLVAIGVTTVPLSLAQELAVEERFMQPALQQPLSSQPTIVQTAAEQLDEPRVESILPEIEKPSAAAPRPCCQSTTKDTYFELEYLLWGLEESHLPGLVAANPIGTPFGGIGNPSDASTQTVLGGQSIGDWAQSGLRFRYGKMVRGERVSRWELSGLFLFEQSETWSVGTDNNGSILSRPFFNTQTGQSDAQIISMPGVAEGSFETEYSRHLLSIDPTLLFCLSGTECSAWEGVTGYRYFRYEDEINLTERVRPEPGGLIAPGTEFLVEDTIRATNDYHLLPLGVNYFRINGPWRLGLRAVMSVGFVRQTVDLRGRTTISVDDDVISVADGGFAVLASNSGKHSRTEFAFVPELNLNVRREIRHGLWFQAGYTLLYLNEVARAPQHLSSSIDPRLLPPAVGTGVDPVFRFVSDGEWIHGLNAGLQWNF